MTRSPSPTCAGCQHAFQEDALYCPHCGRARQRDDGDDGLIGRVLGERFLVQDVLGQGASGTIYRAEHVTLRRKVAIKVLHNELSRDDLAVERFRREATTVAEIDNEHLVEIHDFGRTGDGRLYMAMELLEGETLDHVLEREKTLSIERAADILIQLGEALMEAHAVGYIHRDLRPRNVYLAVRRGKANFIKLLDFGLAKLVDTDAQAAQTSLGMTFGDPRYMSPEQARGDRIDRRADIYQIGCLAYEMLTGAPPFTGGRVFDILAKQVSEIPAPLPTRRKGVPLWMEAAVAKMLAKSADDRFATTSRMVDALRRGLDTGEVMDDDIARRRESIPPPSVSRAMLKMGLAAEPSPDAAETLVTAPVVAAAPVAPMPAAETPKPFDPRATALGHSPGPTRDDSDATKVGVPAAPVAEPRKRTGTPRVGVPVVIAPAASSSAKSIVVEDVQSPVAGTIEAASGKIDMRAKTPSVSPPVVSRAAAAEPRAKRPTSELSTSSASRRNDPIASSSGWFEEGERASSEAEASRVRRARDVISPGASSADFDEDYAPPKKSRLVIWIGLAAVALAGGGIAIAMSGSSGGSSGGKQVAAASPTPIVATAPVVDAAASAAIEPDAPLAAVISAPTPVAPAPTPTPTPVALTPAPTPPVVAHPAPTPTPIAQARPPHSPPPRDVVPAIDDDPASRRPALNLPTTPPPTPTPTPTPPTVTPTPTPTPPPPAKNPNTPAVGGGGPVDPYAATDTPAPPPDDGGGKKAEFYANLGAQQLANNDTAAAAASFKRALELDGKSAAALTGLGEIALRQGLFGDAISHLSRAARLTPKSSRVFTLLGEAYLNSGNTKQAMANFQKALQLDPDNARARDGFNDAQSRQPPPTDDN